LKYYIFLLYTICFISCSEFEINKPNMVYYSPLNGCLWIGNNEIDLNKLKEINKLVFFSLDEVTNELWAMSYSIDKKYINFYYTINGNIDIERKISIERPEKLYFCKQIYNNKILYSADGIEFILIDIITQDFIIFEINSAEGKLPMGYPQEPIGFNENIVVFFNGYYKILEHEYIFLNNIKYPRFIALENIIIGLDIKNKIVIYNINNDKLLNTHIERKILKNVKYDGSSLFYYKNDKLFFSEDIKGLVNATRIFYPRWYSTRKWYIYDQKEKIKNKLKTPNNIVILLGSTI